MNTHTIQLVRAVDVHAHLVSSEFSEDLDEVLERARKEKVMIITSSTSLNEVDATLALAEKEKTVFASIGFQPPLEFSEKAGVDAELVCDAIKKHFGKSGVVAVGEVGLDFAFMRNLSGEPAGRVKRLQEQIFSSFVRTASELDAPIVTHSRSAGQHVIDFIDNWDESKRPERVLMHAFDGKASSAVRASEKHGFLFSIPPSSSFSVQKQKLIERLPLDSLLLETDSPVLGPEPDKRNEPVNVLKSAEVISRIKGSSLDEVLEKTTERALEFFSIKNNI